MFVDEDTVASAPPSSFAIVNHLLLPQVSQSIRHLLDSCRTAVKILEGLGTAVINSRPPVAVPKEKAVHRMRGRRELPLPHMFIQPEKNGYERRKFEPFLFVGHIIPLVGGGVRCCPFLKVHWLPPTR